MKANGARYWAVAEVRRPYRDTEIGTDVVGFAAFAFNGTGRQDNTTWLGFGPHPNVVGQAHIADKWVALLKSVLADKCN